MSWQIIQLLFLTYLFACVESLKKIPRVPKQTEILIVGGGIIGSFVAYWMKTISPNFNVTVIEKDSNVIFH